MQKDHSLFIISTILLQTLFIIIINNNICTSDNIRSLQSVLPWVNIVVFCLGILNILAIKYLAENNKRIVELRLLKNHLHQVEGLLQTLRIKKHEFSRHIQALESFIYLNRNEEALEYINGIAGQNIGMDNLIYTGHMAITGLINSKNAIAESLGIDFAVAVKCDLSRLNIPSWDLCSILGNLLDNAIEAAQQDKEKPRVRIEFKFEAGKYAIYIYNNGAKILANQKENLFQLGYTTKGSKSRGCGLYLVKKLLDEYEGDIDIIAGDKTKVIVRLPHGINDDNSSAPEI